MTGRSPRVVIIGRGEYGHRPHEVGIHFDDPARPLLLAEGTGHHSFGGFEPLQAIRDPAFSHHVAACGCAWLVAMAEEEERGAVFLAEEIYQRWQQLTGGSSEARAQWEIL